MTGSHEVTGSIPVGSTTYSAEIPRERLGDDLHDATVGVGLLLFEDDQLEGFGPLTRTRPAFELRVGCLNLRERLELALPGARIEASVRAELRPLLSATLGAGEGAGERDHWIAINARAHASVEALRIFIRDRLQGSGHCATGSELVGAWGPRDVVEERLAAGAADAGPVPEGLRLHRFYWDLVAANEAAIEDDAREFRSALHYHARSFGGDASAEAALRIVYDGGGPEPLAAFVQIAGAENVLLGEGVRLKPGVVLDAEEGSIVLAPGSSIAANATLVGPCYVGPGAVVNPGAKLREGSSVGRMCKVGGEIEESIFLDYANKQHDGFLGHAVVGSWVNLGADTNASDLKNNYGNVRVDFGTGAVDSGERFVGPVFGDHAKTGINSMLNTGSVVGVSANVFGAGFPPRHVADFAWGGADGFRHYDLERALATARTVMGRRSVPFLEEHEQLLRLLHARACS